MQKATQTKLPSDFNIRVRHYADILNPLFWHDSFHIATVLFEYACTLVRVGGMQDEGWDAYLESQAMLGDLKKLADMELPTEEFSDIERTRTCAEESRNSLVRLSRVSPRSSDEPARRRGERSDDPAYLAPFGCERDTTRVHQTFATAGNRCDGEDSNSDGQGCCGGSGRERELRSRKSDSVNRARRDPSSSPFLHFDSGILGQLVPQLFPS
jgi:hypothetical protein